MLYRMENPHGGDIYREKIRLDFSANTNPLGTPESAVDAMRGALGEVHNYPDPYCRELVCAIAEFEEVSKEYILCGNGAAELIYAYCNAVKPKVAAELAPTFSEYSAALSCAGGKMERYALAQGAGFELDEGFLRFLERKKPEAVFLANPNNPTGRCVSEKLKEKIVRLCKKEGIYLFVDECFLDLSDDKVSFKKYISEYNRIIILKAFTKSYGMAGLRLGYCISGDENLLCEMARCTSPWNVSLLAQTAGVAVLRDREFLKKALEIVRTERGILCSALKELGFWVCPPEANFILFKGSEGLDKKLREKGIAIRSCGNFCGLGDEWYRIAVRRHEENKALIDAMREICGRR